jgi:hypothetical protein
MSRDSQPTKQPRPQRVRVWLTAARDPAPVLPASPRAKKKTACGEALGRSSKAPPPPLVSRLTRPSTYVVVASPAGLAIAITTVAAAACAGSDSSKKESVRACTGAGSAGQHGSAARSPVAFRSGERRGGGHRSHGRAQPCKVASLLRRAREGEPARRPGSGEGSKRGEAEAEAEARR